MTKKDTGHVLTATEKYAEELSSLVVPRKVMSTELRYVLSDEEIAVLATFIRDKVDAEYYRALHMGIGNGQKEFMLTEASYLDFLLRWKDSKDMDVWKELQQRRDYLEKQAVEALQEGKAA